MKLFANSIASGKTSKAFQNQIEMVSKCFNFHKRVEDKYIFDGSYGDIITVYQRINSKFFSRLYSLVLKVEINNPPTEDCFRYKMIFEGMINQKPVFKSVSGNRKELDKLNTEENLSKIYSCTKKVHLESLFIYSQSEKIYVDIIPYPGSIVWLVIPPITYHIRIKQEEIKALAELIQSLVKIIKA